LLSGYRSCTNTVLSRLGTLKLIGCTAWSVSFNILATSHCIKSHERFGMRQTDLCESPPTATLLIGKSFAPSSSYMRTFISPFPHKNSKFVSGSNNGVTIPLLVSSLSLCAGSSKFLKSHNANSRSRIAVCPHVTNISVFVF